MREHQHFFGSMHTKELWEEKVKFWRNYNVMKL